MPKILKARRVHNPRKRKKKLSAKQIKFFGTKRQRAALRSRPKRKRKVSRSISNPTIRRAGKHRRVARRRRKNVGEILTASLAGLNPGRRKGMARRRRSKVSSHRRRRSRTRAVNPRRRRRAVVHHRRRRRTSNPRVVVRYRGRKRNRVRGRRRNPSMLSGKLGKVVGVLGGAALTSFISTQFIPAQFNTGIMGYFASGIVAFAQGKIVGKISKSPALGDDMFIGGLAYVALRVVSDMVPSIANMLPFKLNGLGLIAPSSFYVPQVNMPGSMSTFQVPSAVPSMVAAGGMHGLGMTRGRRVGRMGY